MEVWKDVIGYENIYQISNLGKLKNKITNKVRKLTINGSGYLLINLTKDFKETTFRFHRLLAIHFIPNPNNYDCVNHINGIKIDNRLENLEWCSHRENMSHSALNRKKTSKYPGVSWSKMMNKWYAQIRINNKTIPIGYSSTEEEAYNNYKQFLKTQNIINKYGTTK